MYRQERAGPGQCLHVIMQKDTMMVTTIKRRIFYIFIKTFWEKKNPLLCLWQDCMGHLLSRPVHPFPPFQVSARGCFHCHSSDTAGLTCISSNESCFLSPKYRHSRWLLISSSHAKSSLISSLSFLTCL